MSSEQPFALHVTWTCYGTWLPGDRRGHVSNLVLPEGGFLQKENTPGTPWRQGDDFTHQRAQAIQQQDTVYLTPEQALVVAVSLCETARKRGWRILRGAIMANHIHAVVMDCPNDGPLVRRILKGTSQAALNDHVGHNQKWWTAGGSNRYKNDWPAIETATQYVTDQVGMLASIIDGRAAGFIPAETSSAEAPSAGINPAARLEMTLTRATVLRLLAPYQPLALQQVHDLLYFLQQAGEPLNLRFRTEPQGPYAENLEDVLRRFEGHFTLGFGPGPKSLTTPITLIPQAVATAEEFAASHEADGRQASARLERVRQLLLGFESPQRLGLLAGVHLVASHPEERATTMNPEQVRIAWERLRQMGWL